MILGGLKLNSGFVINNNVYVGSTGFLITGNLIRNYSYVSQTKKLVEIQSAPISAGPFTGTGYYPALQFKSLTPTPPPPKFYSITGSGFYASVVYETCHGINYSGLINDKNLSVGKTGDYNFYMAPYGPGYYQPPVGELPTIAEQSFGFSKPFKKQIDDLNLSDYLKIFGLRIASKINNFIPCKNYNLTAFHEGITDCPITSQQAFKYSEIQPELAAGTYLGSIGGNIYNHNPIPSSYDRGVLVATTLYKSAPPTPAGSPPKVPKEIQESCVYVVNQGKPIPSFLRGSSASSSNYVFGRCANLSEIDRQALAVGAVDGHTNASVGNPKDILSDGDLGEDTSNYDQSIYWNFVFKNNHESLPFANTHEASTMTQDNDQVREDHWWEHRECPENIDYLNHAFGNNINACPMNYVDVPYYAAIGKFGYFGTRFQDTWRSVSNDSTGIGINKKYIDFPNELDANGDETYNVKKNVTYPDFREEYSSYSRNFGGSDYDPLIKASALEKKYHDFAFSDRVLFLRLNYNLSKTSTQYAYLKTGIADFENLYLGLCTGVDATGLSSTDAAKFKVSYINQGSSFIPVDDPIYSFTNSYITTGKYDPNDLIQFNEFVKKYGVFKLINDSSADTSWYDKITNEKRIRIARNYYGNIASGKPVDLFPNNQIAFSFEKTIDFAKSDFIKYGSVTNSAQVKGKTLPEVKRQYFSAGFSTIFEASGYAQYTNHKVSNDTINDIPIKTNLFRYTNNNFTSSVNNFYLGYTNPRGCGNENFITSSNSYLELINLPNVGIFKDYAPETSPPPATAAGSPIRTPWPDAGFAGIGRVNKNFSCFSPIFLQQPLNEAVKLCQAPKFRVCAVDYHSISDDKIKENRQGGGSAYPEIAYWLRKIKAINTKGDNLYPLSYKWSRVQKASAMQYLATKNASLLDFSNPTGSWCCAEDGYGNTPECTVIRPKECINMSSVALTSWIGNSEDSVLRFMGVKDSDTNFYYFCTVAGRFGWRDSEFASVTVDKNVKIQIATMDSCGGGGGSAAALSVAGMIGFLNIQNGYLIDRGVHFEQVKDTIWNDGNNCMSVRFVGPEQLRGVTRVYTPGTFVDSRGKRVRNAHWKDFGALSSVSFTLTNASAALLYANRALPYCDRSSNFLYQGQPMLLKGYVHRTHFEAAVLTENTTYGVRANKLRSIAEAYPPRRYIEASPIANWDHKNPGHHQFETNLGSIKKYSTNRQFNNSLSNAGALGGVGGLDGEDQNVYVLPSSLQKDVNYRERMMNDFDKALRLNGSRIITGPECGYVAPSLGRLMHFYVESFSTYYSLCMQGPKPKKVRNWSHIAGGLRSGKAGLQYNWLGKPSDARLKRVSMPGPYAFQWKVERHNRDRSGNGMPLSFWSYNYEERIDNLYDAAAVYGAVKKTSSHSVLTPAQKLKRIKAAMDINGISTPVSLRNVSIGPDEGPQLSCGNIRWRASGEMGGDKPTSGFVDWMQSVANPAGPDPFSAYGCGGPYADDCFYPCLSLKYPEGFTPRGGKNLGYRNGSERHYFTSSIIGSSYYSASVPGSLVSYRVFAVDLSPCSTNKKDICNYLTPTAHIGLDTWPFGTVSNNAAYLTSISNL